MDEELQDRYKQRYSAAVDSFVDKVRSDPNIIAVVVCGSLTYDVVWENSDIDITLIVRDQILNNTSYCIIEYGITLSIELRPRSKFKRYLENSLGGSFNQSYYSNANLVYTTDESLYEYFEEMKNIGIDDIPLTAFLIAGEVFYYKKKSTKWVNARRDPLYAQWFLLMAAESLAKMELCINGMPFSRDGIQKALALNPLLLNPFYQEAMSHHYSEEEVLAAIRKIEIYMEQHLDLLKQPALDYLSDQEMRTVTMINKHFRASGDFLIYVFDYLAEKGIIEKVSKTIRITPKSKPSVEEIGYMLIK